MTWGIAEDKSRACELDPDNSWRPRDRRNWMIWTTNSSGDEAVIEMSEIAAWAIMPLGAEQCHDSPVENYLKDAFISPNMQITCLSRSWWEKVCKSFLVTVKRSKGECSLNVASLNYGLNLQINKFKFIRKKTTLTPTAIKSHYKNQDWKHIIDKHTQQLYTDNYILQLMIIQAISR